MKTLISEGKNTLRWKDYHEESERETKERKRKSKMTSIRIAFGSCAERKRKRIGYNETCAHMHKEEEKKVKLKGTSATKWLTKFVSSSRHQHVCLPHTFDGSSCPSCVSLTALNNNNIIIIVVIIIIAVVPTSIIPAIVVVQVCFPFLFLSFVKFEPPTCEANSKYVKTTTTATNR